MTAYLYQCEGCRHVYVDDGVRPPRKRCPGCKADARQRVVVRLPVEVI